MIVVNYHDDLNEVQGDRVLAALLRAPDARAPFDRIEWWQGLVRHCGLLPLIAVARDGVRRCALPLLRQGRDIAALGNWYNFTVAPIMAAGDSDLDLFTALARDLAGQAPRVTLAPLAEEAADLTERAFSNAGWAVWRDQCDINHVLHLKGRSYADYLAARPGPLRTTLKRKTNKVSVIIETTFNPASWAAYEAIYAQSWKPEEGSPEFLRAFAQEEGAAGRLRLALAHADGEPVAAQFWTVENGTAYIHKLAHTEASKPLSPGTTLSAALFERVIDIDKVETVDFGTGDNPYKRDWMEEIRPRYRLTMYRPGWPGNWPRMAKAALRHMLKRG
ncbi:MAG: GNAT family N-acetyltransferase [Novosphingobium sp.]